MEATGGIGDVQVRLQTGARMSSSSAGLRRSAAPRLCFRQRGNGRETRRLRLGKRPKERRFSLVLRIGEARGMLGNSYLYQQVGSL